MAEWLVWPPTDCGVPAQQPHPLCDTATSVPTRYWMNPPYGLWTKPSPLQTRDSQQIHGVDEIRHWRGQISNLQGTGRHNAVLQSKENFSPYVQTRRPGIFRHIRHQNNTSISKVVTLQTGTLWNRTLSRTISLLSQVTSRNEAVVPSVQRRKVVCCSRRSDPREETASPAATHHRCQRRRVGSRRNTR